MIIFTITSYNNQPATLHHKDKFVFCYSHIIPHVCIYYGYKEIALHINQFSSAFSQTRSYRPMMIWYQPIISPSKWELLLPNYIIHNLYMVYKDKQRSLSQILIRAKMAQENHQGQSLGHCGLWLMTLWLSWASCRHLRHLT